MDNQGTMMIRFVTAILTRCGSHTFRAMIQKHSGLNYAFDVRSTEIFNTQKLNREEWTLDSHYSGEPTRFLNDPKGRDKPVPNCQVSSSYLFFCSTFAV